MLCLARPGSHVHSGANGRIPAEPFRGSGSSQSLSAVLCDSNTYIFALKPNILAYKTANRKFNDIVIFLLLLGVFIFLFHFILLENSCHVQPTPLFSCLSNEFQPAVCKAPF